MIRAFFLSLLLLFATAPADAQHSVFIGTGFQAAVTGPSCPFPVDNGCAGSIPGQTGSSAVLLSNARLSPATNMVNLLTGSPTDYSVNGPAVNEPSIDYWTGEPLPLSSLGDPTTSLPSLYPGVCAYNPTGQTSGGPLITCTVNGTTSITVDSYDFTVGGTTCVPLSLLGNTTGTITITKNNWKSNGNCLVNGIANLQFVGESATLSGATIVVEYNTFDANIQNFPYGYGSCNPNTVPQPQCNPSEVFILIGAATAEYNAILGFNGRTVQYSSQNLASGFTFQYNYVQGCCTSNPAAHGEFEEYSGNPGGSGQIYDSNTWIMTTGHHNSGQAAFPLQLTTINDIPIFDISNNFYVPGASGGINPPTGPTGVVGTITGNTFTTTAIASGQLGSGASFNCGTSPNTVGIMLVYDGTNTGVVSAGPGGGGHSTGAATTWPLTWTSSLMQGGIDDGSGGAGNIVTITNDPTLVIQVGTAFSLGGVSHTVTSFGTGTGGNGTYNVGGSAQLLAVGTISATPNNIYPGGWSVPGTLSCTAVSTGGIPFTRAIADETNGEMTQVTHIGNYVDLWVYGPGTSGHIWSQRTSIGSFEGQIAGTALTLIPATYSTTVNAKGSGYTGTATVAYGSGCVTAPTGTVNLSGGQVASITQASFGFNCTSTPSVTISGTGTGATATANVAFFSGVAPLIGNRITTTTGVAADTDIVSGTSPNFVVSVSQTVGPVVMTPVSTSCFNPTIWGGNVDMSGIYNSTFMNAYGSENVPGNGCQ